MAEGFAELADLLRKQCLFDNAESYAQQAVSVLLRTDAAAAVKGQCLLSHIFCDAGRYRALNKYALPKCHAMLNVNLRR